MFVAQPSHPIAHAVRFRRKGQSGGSVAQAYAQCSDIISISCD